MVTSKVFFVTNDLELVTNITYGPKVEEWWHKPFVNGWRLIFDITFGWRMHERRRVRSYAWWKTSGGQVKGWEPLNHRLWRNNTCRTRWLTMEMFIKSWLENSKRWHQGNCRKSLSLCKHTLFSCSWFLWQGSVCLHLVVILECLIKG